MTTKNIVPRATGEGSLGTATKKWGNIYADYITLEDGETLQTKIANQNSRITTAEGTVSTLSGDVTSLYGSVDELSDGKLNLSGGTITGSITCGNSSETTFGARSTTDSSIAIRGGTRYSDGGSLIAYGKDSSSFSGAVRLIAHDGTNTVSLNAYPDGVLQWNAKDIERVNASGTNYIRYESGLQICWGGANISQATEFTYGASFKSGTIPVVTTSCTGNKLIYLSAISNTSVTFASATYSSYARYIAIGFWK